MPYCIAIGMSLAIHCITGASRETDLTALLLHVFALHAGRWKAVTVAVKIIEHSERSPGTASSGGKRINIVRESLLATQMSHPNIVSRRATAAATAAAAAVPLHNGSSSASMANVDVVS
jgi:hypothetical protein